MKTKKIRTELRFDEERAELVFRIADRMWAERDTPGTEGNLFLGGILLPQDMYPRPSDPHRHALWLFYCAIFMRGGVISEDPFRPLWALWNKYPGMFEPATVVAQWSPRRIMRAFHSVGFSKYKRKEHAKAWHFNSVTLAEEWNSDPLRIFEGVSDFEQAFRRVDYARGHADRRGGGIVGMRRKIFSLYVIWLREVGLIPAFPSPIPVDFHAMRILFGTGIVQVEAAQPFVPNPEKPGQEKLSQFQTVLRVTEDMVDQITLWSQAFIGRMGLDPARINPFLWVWSREFCVQHKQNGSIDEGLDYFTADALRADPRLWGRKYRDVCHLCPLQTVCSGSVPNKPHYLWGLLALIPRLDHAARLSGMLSGVSWDEHEILFRAKSHPRPRRADHAADPSKGKRKKKGPVHADRFLFDKDEEKS